MPKKPCTPKNKHEINKLRTINKNIDKKVEISSLEETCLYVNRFDFFMIIILTLTGCRKPWPLPVYRLLSNEQTWPYLHY